MLLWAEAAGADRSAASTGKNKATGFQSVFCTNPDAVTTACPLIALFNPNTSAL